MIITISHQLSFSAGGGRFVAHLLLTPLSGPSQSVKDWAIDMPGIETATRFIDAFGNRALLVTQARTEGELRVTVKGKVETQGGNGVLGRIAAEPVVALYRRVTPLTEPDERFVAPFADADRQGPARIGLYHAIMDRIGEHYRFEAAEAQAQSQSSGEQAQSQSQGGAEGRELVEADRFAHAFVATVRALGLPARYVTGYLAAEEDRPAAFHAWAEAYDEGLGWIAFDPALGLCPTDRHVRVAVGLDALATQAVRIVPALGEPKLIDISVEAGAAQ